MHKYVLLVLIIGFVTQKMTLGLMVMAGRARVALRVGGGLRGAVRMMAASEAKPKQAKKKKPKSPYSDTVILPSTTFDQRANAAKKEPEIQQVGAQLLVPTPSNRYPFLV